LPFQSGRFIQALTACQLPSQSGSKSPSNTLSANFPLSESIAENRKRLPQEKRHKPRPNHEGGCFASVRRHRQENHVAESKIEDGYNGFFPKLKEVWSLDEVKIAC
jgi:hypothetical protein